MGETSDSYVTVIWEARAKQGMAVEMKRFLTAVVTSSRHDHGCIDYEFHEVEGQPGTFIAYERWASQSALDGHLQSDRMREKAPKLLELMEGSIEAGLRFLKPFRPAG